MSWHWIALTIPASTLEADRVGVRIELPYGRIRGWSVLMPATTNAQEIGLRINTPERRILPAQSEGSATWLYSMPFAISLYWPDELDLAPVSPVYIGLEAFKTSAGAAVVQVGIQLAMHEREALRYVRTIAAAVEAMERASRWPEVETQIRRVLDWARALWRGPSRKEG